MVNDESINSEFIILIVDDSPVNIALIAEMLVKEGYLIDSAKNGLEALEKTKSEHFDLMLLDIMMPQMDGFELCSIIKSNPLTSDIPVIFLTALNDVKSIVKGFEFGGTDYITKPFQKAELVARVRNQIELKRSKQKLHNELEEKKKAEKALTESERKFRTIFENSPAGILLTDENGRIIEWNSGMQQITGLKRVDIVLQPLWKCMYKLTHKNGQKDVNSVFQEEIFKEILKTGSSQFYIVNQPLELLFYINNEIKNIYLISYIIKTDTGNRIVSIIQDITERKKVEAAIKESEEKFRNIFSHSNDGIVIIDATGKFLEVNEVTTNLLGYPKDELLAMNVKDVVAPQFKELIIHRFKDIGFYRENPINELEITTKDGRNVPFEINSRLVTYRESNALLSIMRDLTDRKMMERKILSTIIETEEKERNRFAKDLHDGLGALLSSINIYINLIRSGDLSEPEKENMLIFTKGLIDQAITSTKEIANDLMPTILNRFGLVASIENFCNQINNTRAMTLNFDYINFKVNLDKNTEIILFRIVNELINNTIKHADAQNVNLKLATLNQSLYMDYSDDGKGFDLINIEKSKKIGMGLENIRSRIKSINGHVEMKSDVGKGFNVNIEIKL